MSLLVQDNDLITITIFYTLSKNKYGCKFVKVLDDAKAKELLTVPESADQVKVLNTRWRPQTWAAQNDLFANSTVYNQSTGERQIDWSKFRDAQMKHCLVDWDLVDDNGRPYPVNDDNINSLHASIANTMSNRYGEAISLEEGEAGELPKQQ